METDLKARFIEDEIKGVELGIKDQEARKETQEVLAQLTILHNERARLYNRYHEVTGNAYKESRN